MALVGLLGKLEVEHLVHTTVLVTARLLSFFAIHGMSCPDVPSPTPDFDVPQTRLAINHQELSSLIWHSPCPEGTMHDESNHHSK